MQGDLTTLARVREWLAPGTGSLSTSNDPLLSRLVTTASVFVLNYINRTTLAATNYDEYLDNGGVDFTLLRQWPVISLSSLQFCGVTVSSPATGNPPQNGYLLEPPPEGGGQQRVMIYGWRFPRGRSVVRTIYRAGYQIVGEPHLVMDSTPGTPDPVSTNFTWLEDGGVTYANGTALVLVTGTPAAGQYAVSSDGIYSFAVADIGQTMLVTYSYVPPDIEQAVIELVGERFRQRDRIGLNRKNLPNGENVSFLVKDMSEHIRTALQPYRRVTPT